MKRVAVCTWLAWAGLAGCNSDSNGGPTDDNPTKGTVQFEVRGTASFARAWDLDAYQDPPSGPDYTRSIELSFESSLATRANEDSLWVLVDLFSDGYTGPDTYACGINTTPALTLCYIRLSHYLDASTLPGPWQIGPAPGPHPNCSFTINQDDTAGFNGSVYCEVLDFREDLPAEQYNLNHPDRDKRVDVSGTWSFRQRLIYRPQ